MLQHAITGDNSCCNLDEIIALLWACNPATSTRVKQHFKISREGYGFLLVCKLAPFAACGYMKPHIYILYIGRGCRWSHANCMQKGL